MSEDRTFVISEIGVNHNGDMDLARQMIKASSKAGVDAVKFQSFKTENLVTQSASQADYQAKNMEQEKGNQYDMLKKLELSDQDHKDLQRYAQECGVEFMSSPFDSESLERLIDLKVARLKIPSGEAQNYPLLLEIGRSGLPAIISTGMGTIETIEKSLQVLAFGCGAPKNADPSWENFEAFYLQGEAREVLKNKVSILHCTTNYPAPLDEINLKAMDTIKEKFGLPVGYSDHSDGILMSIAAVARGATIIEKHFTLDRGMSGPDHKASTEPDAFAEMVSAIRDIEKALGTGIKKPFESELAIQDVACKKLVARENIKAGEVLTEKNITAKRSSDEAGMSTAFYWSVLGRTATIDIGVDDAITPSKLNGAAPS